MMKSPFHDRQFKTVLSYFLLAVAVIIAYKFIMGIDVFLNLIKRFLDIISPFIIGFLIAYVLNIPCGGIQRLLKKAKNKFIYNKSRMLSVVLVYLLSFLVVVLILRILIPSLYRSGSNFVSNFDHYYKGAQNFIDDLNDLDILNIDISIDKILNTVREFTLQKLPSSLNTLFNVSTGLLNGFIALISSVYILLEKESFKKYLDRLMKAFLPENVYHVVLKYSKNLNMNFKQYIYTQTVDGCILGTIATIELFLLKSPYALLLGVMLGIVNYIPYFGSIFGSVFTLLVVAFTQDITIAALATIILLFTQQIDANVIQPRLMSGSFSLSPLLVIVSITIGGAISGILGMIMAIPIVAVAKDIVDELIIHYENRKSVDSLDR
jgi:predicted PurR-regulated permease PerM